MKLNNTQMTLLIFFVMLIIYWILRNLNNTIEKFDNDAKCKKKSANKKIKYSSDCTFYNVPDDCTLMEEKTGLLFTCKNGYALPNTQTPNKIICPGDSIYNKKTGYCYDYGNDNNSNCAKYEDLTIQIKKSSDCKTVPDGCFIRDGTTDAAKRGYMRWWQCLNGKPLAKCDGSCPGYPFADEGINSNGICYDKDDKNAPKPSPKPRLKFIGPDCIVPPPEWKEAVVKNIVPTVNTNYSFNNMEPYSAFKFMSKSGKYMYITPNNTIDKQDNGNYFWYSSDYGKTWLNNTNINLTTSDGDIIINGIFANGSLCNFGACSDDGKIVYICVNFGFPFIYMSTDYGVTFLPPYKLPGVLISGIACNTDGTIVYASMYNQPISLYKSTNGGSANMSFVPINNTCSKKINGLCCSSDGNVIYYGVNNTTGDDSYFCVSQDIYTDKYYNSGLYVSTNGGISFTRYSTDKTVHLICNSSGSIAYGYINDTRDLIKITNYGSTITPMTNLPLSASIACDSTGLILWFQSNTNSGNIYVSNDGGLTAKVSYTYPEKYTLSNNIACNALGNIVITEINSTILNTTKTIIYM